jgi:protein O-mannosyl-transferase
LILIQSLCILEPVNLLTAPNRIGLGALLLVAGTVIVYLPIWHAGLIWDDRTFVVENPLIRRADGLYDIWFSTTPVSFNPLTSSTLWLEWRLWNSAPLGYHLVNVLLHSLNAVLLWVVLRWLNLRGSWLASALFAVHPVNVESVAWISERKNTLAMFFCLLSVLGYLRFEVSPRTSPRAGHAGDDARAAAVRENWRWYWLALGAFVLSLLSKSATAPLPFVLLGLAWWCRGRVQRRDFIRSVPFFFASIIVGSISHWFEVHRAIGIDPVPQVSVWTRLASAGFAVWFYLYKALLPFDLRSIYPRWQIDATQWYSFLPLVLVCVAAHACWRYRAVLGKSPALSVGYFLLMLLPVLGFLDINFMRYSPVADRWQYFAIIGPIALVAAAAAPALGLSDERLFWKAAISSAILVVLGALSYRQCGIYGDPVTFWQAAVTGNPDSAVAHNNLGTVLLERSRLDEAKAQFQEVLAMDPDHAMAHYNLGGVLREQGQVDQAMAELQRAVDLAPGHAEAQLRLGELQAVRGRLDEAITHLQSALELKPHDADAHNGIGLLLLRRGAVDSALAHFQRAVELKPGFAEAHGNLARALSETGQVDGAMAQLEQVIDLQPGQPEAYNNLANLLRREGRFPEAAARYRKALELRPSYVTAHYNLGELLQQIGKPTEAVAQFQIALELRPDFAPARRALDKTSADAHGELSAPSK